MNEHAPQLSVWPVLLGLAITLIAIGILATWIIALLGVALLLYVLWSWSQENRVSEEFESLPVEMEIEERQHE